MGRIVADAIVLEEQRSIVIHHARFSIDTYMVLFLR